MFKVDYLLDFEQHFEQSTQFNGQSEITSKSLRGQSAILFINFFVRTFPYCCCCRELVGPDLPGYLGFQCLFLYYEFPCFVRVPLFSFVIYETCKFLAVRLNASVTLF